MSERRDAHEFLDAVAETFGPELARGAAVLLRQKAKRKELLHQRAAAEEGGGETDP